MCPHGSPPLWIIRPDLTTVPGPAQDGQSAEGGDLPAGDVQRRPRDLWPRSRRHHPFTPRSDGSPPSPVEWATGLSAPAERVGRVVRGVLHLRLCLVRRAFGFHVPVVCCPADVLLGRALDILGLVLDLVVEAHLIFPSSQGGLWNLPSEGSVPVIGPPKRAEDRIR